ncbi:hypothetical protein C9374_004806 [Naegleria lovaniensis]|uniref:Uncharacterized protein n=1 Tax=Naegleria lovaniensis TaxID=51637 RepID=A0AA88GPI4_NAELO|nr:uncharacterized protein C9374_004806 [Naegleria lovaniensis]KAG2382839.1 hypothetical protein C9374_004806 [Naegleria lovaniensis]
MPISPPSFSTVSSSNNNLPIQVMDQDSNEKESNNNNNNNIHTFNSVPTLSLPLSPNIPQPPEFSNLQISQSYSEPHHLSTSSSPSVQQMQPQTVPSYEQQSYELYNSNIGLYHPQAVGTQMDESPPGLMREEFIVQHPSQYSSVSPMDASTTSFDTMNSSQYSQQVFIQQRPYEIQSIVIPTQFARSPYEQQQQLPTNVVVIEHEEQENPSQVMMEHHYKNDNGNTGEFQQLSQEPITSSQQLLNWVKNNRVFALFLVCDIALLIFGTGLAIVNSFVHVILCIIVSVLPFALVFSQKSPSRRHTTKWRVVASFLLGALFADNIAATIYVWYQLLREDHQHAWEIVLILAFTFLQYIVAVLGCVVIYRTIMNDRRNSNSVNHNNGSENYA